MPGFLTHYIFGTKAIRKIQYSYIKKSISTNKEVYNLGLQGPDIFFYFIPYKMINKTNLGSVLHRNKIKDFFETAIKIIINCKDEEKKEIMTAYIVGFFGHYILDKNCHPYIFFKSGYMYINKNYNEKHVKLESDIDYIYAREFYGKKNIDLNYGNLVDLDNYQRKVISSLLDDVCNKLFNEIWLNKRIAEIVIYNFKILIDFFNDKNGKKYKYFNLIEKRVTGSEKMSSVFNGNCYKIKYTDPMNNSKRSWYNPWNVQEKKSLTFYELCNSAEEEFGEFTNILGVCIEQNNISKFKKYMKNCSYITGLEVE